MDPYRPATYRIAVSAIPCTPGPQPLCYRASLLDTPAPAGAAG